MTIALRDGVTRVSDITSAVGDSRLDTEMLPGAWNLASTSYVNAEP